MLKFSFSLIILITTSFFGVHSTYAQIESDGEKISKQIKKETIKVNSGTEFYIGITPSYTYRTLKPNNGLFGEPIGERENEEGKWVSSFGIGVRSSLTRNFGFEFGVGFNREREYYSFEDIDTSYLYTSTYNYLNFPLKISFFTPGRISFYSAAGLAPKVFFQQKQEITFNDGTSFDQEEEVIIKDGFNTMLIDVVINAGIRLNATDAWGAYILPEFRYQLNNTYDKQAPFIRKPYAIGLQFGLQFNL